MRIYEAAFKNKKKQTVHELLAVDDDDNCKVLSKWVKRGEKSCAIQCNSSLKESAARVDCLIGCPRFSDYFLLFFKCIPSVYIAAAAEYIDLLYRRKEARVLRPVWLLLPPDRLNAFILHNILSVSLLFLILSFLFPFFLWMCYLQPCCWFQVNYYSAGE